MKRVLFIGNSHVAAMRAAWLADRGRWPGISAAFAGGHRNTLLETEIRDGVLCGRSGAARSALSRLSSVPVIRPGDYDAVVVTGCQVSVAAILPVWHGLRWVGLPSVAAAGDLAAAPFGLCGRETAVAAMAGVLGTRLGPRLAAHLAPHVRGPVHVTAQPRASATLRGGRAPHTYLHRVALSAGDGPGISAAFEAAAGRAVAAAGGLYLPQPASTIAGSILTRAAFMHGAERLTGTPGTAQPDDDIRHANACYGALVVDGVVAALRASATVM